MASKTFIIEKLYEIENAYDKSKDQDYIKDMIRLT